MILCISAGGSCKGALLLGGGIERFINPARLLLAVSLMEVLDIRSFFPVSIAPADVTELQINEKDYSSPTPRVLDLAALVDSPQLDTLELIAMRLQALQHAEALLQCPRLSCLSLPHNLLTEFDLSVLRNCSRLRWLYLEGNLLTELDLRQVAHWPLLDKLYISGNRLQTLDLAPLAQCSQLRQISLGGNPLAHVDLTPLLHNPLLETLRVEDRRGFPSYHPHMAEIRTNIQRFPASVFIPAPSGPYSPDLIISCYDPGLNSYDPTTTSIEYDADFYCVAIRDTAGLYFFPKDGTWAQHPAYQRRYRLQKHADGSHSWERLP